MKTHTLILASLIALLTAPLAAQEAKTCDVETMNMVIEQVNNAAEGVKAAATGELDMAKEQMEAGDAELCGTHLTNASTLAMTE
jgi:hypothetical protein